jgi:hypothetical protein
MPAAANGLQRACAKVDMPQRYRLRGQDTM